jgi:ankyrin repeat protein
LRLTYHAPEIPFSKSTLSDALSSMCQTKEKMKKLDFIKFLLNHGAKSDQALLYASCYDNEVCELLLNYGADLNTSVHVSWTDALSFNEMYRTGLHRRTQTHNTIRFFKNALCCAAYCGNVRTCELLLKHNANSNIGYGALYSAVIGTQYDVIEMLMKHNVKPVMSNNWVHFVLKPINQLRYKNIKEYLLSSGVIFTKKNNYKYLLLIFDLFLYNRMITKLQLMIHKFFLSLLIYNDRF